MNTSKLTQFVGVAGNISQLIIAGSILCDLYFRFRPNKTAAPVINPDDGNDDSPAPSTNPLPNAA